MKKEHSELNVKKPFLIAGALLFVIGCVLIVFLMTSSTSSSTTYRIWEGKSSKVIKKDTDTYAIGVTQMSASIHPYAQDNQTTDILRKLVYPSLLEIREDGRLEYQLAEEIHVKDKGEKIEVTLKKGLTFSDGSALNAQAVKAAYEWHSNIKHNSSFAKYTYNIDTIQVKDHEHVNFLMKHRDRQLAELCSVPIMRCTKKQETFAGSGSYRIKELHPLSDLTLVPSSSGSHPYQKIHVAVMNYGELAGIVRKQQKDMFMIGDQKQLAVLKKSEAYDVYALTKQEGMYLVLQEKQLDEAQRQTLLYDLDAKAITDALKDDKLLAAEGILSSRKEGTTFKDGMDATKAKPKTLVLQHGATSIARATAKNLQSQWKKQGISLALEEFQADTDNAQSADAYLYYGSSDELLQGKDLQPFFDTLDDVEMKDYNDKLEKYLGEKAWFMPLYTQLDWYGNLHGYEHLDLLG